MHDVQGSICSAHGEDFPYQVLDCVWALISEIAPLSAKICEGVQAPLVLLQPIGEMVKQLPLHGVPCTSR